MWWIEYTHYEDNPLAEFGVSYYLGSGFVEIPEMDREGFHISCANAHIIPRIHKDVGPHVLWEV